MILYWTSWLLTCLHLNFLSTSVADPGFPIGGGMDLVRGAVDPRGGYVSKILHVKTKESGPVGGGGARPPLDPPMNLLPVCNGVHAVLCTILRHSISSKKETLCICVEMYIFKMPRQLTAEDTASAGWNVTDTRQFKHQLKTRWLYAFVGRNDMRIYKWFFFKIFYVL